MKIVVVGLGYVGLSNAIILAQHNDVIGIDISKKRVDMLNTKNSPLEDKELLKFLKEKKLNLRASVNLQDSVVGADYVVIATPTNYDENKFFDTKSVEGVIEQVIQYAPRACIVIKSTVPVGFVENIKKRLKTLFIFPRVSCEDRALHDNLIQVE